MYGTGTCYDIKGPQKCHIKEATSKVMYYISLSLWIQNTNWQLRGAGIGQTPLHACGIYLHHAVQECLRTRAR